MIKNAYFSDIEPIVEYMKSVPFDVSRNKLYSATELYEGYNPELPETYFSCYDQLTYKHKPGMMSTMSGSLSTCSEN